MPTLQSETTVPQRVPTLDADKRNEVDFRWYVVRSLPHQERKLAAIFRERMAEEKNVLEVYCPTHTTVSVSARGGYVQAPLFAGFVFVLSTHRAVSAIVDRYYPEGTVMYDRRRTADRKPRLLTVPEEQMRSFMDFNDNYADKVIVLERPYSDYAFNPKTGRPNEIVRVVSGPLAGKEGYLTRFRRDKRIVFNVSGIEPGRSFAVSIPDAWSLHVVRLHNAAADRQTVGTQKERAADLLIGIIQGCGYGDSVLAMFRSVMGYLTLTPTFNGLCAYLDGNGDSRLSRRIAALTTDEAGQILNLVRYVKDNPGYLRDNFSRLVIRPFLTPTAGVEMPEGQGEALLPHASFTEVIRRVGITEPTFYPDRHKEEPVTTYYYAHVGIMPSAGASCCGPGSKVKQPTRAIIFANWDVFLDKYFHTAGKANEKLVKGAFAPEGASAADRDKLVESFRSYAPTLYAVLTDSASAVKAVPALRVGGETINVLAIETTAAEVANLSADAAVANAANELISTCVKICTELNSTIHLAVWRRYLRTVWLHS